MASVDATTALAGRDVVIDFTTGEASAALAETVRRARRPALVIGSTGLATSAELARLDAAAGTDRHRASPATSRWA